MTELYWYKELMLKVTTDPNLVDLKIRAPKLFKHV